MGYLKVHPSNVTSNRSIPTGTKSSFIKTAISVNRERRGKGKERFKESKAKERRVYPQNTDK